MAFINVEDEQVVKDLYRLNVFLGLFVIDKLDTHSPMEDDEVIPQCHATVRSWLWTLASDR